MSLPLLALLALLSGLSTALEPASIPAPRPNILYFYVDDMGWGSIGPNGQAERRARGLPSVRTPNLDRLAVAGINFSRGYGCHVCSPARSSQQSGFHQGHTFADNNDPNNARKAMRADEILMGDALSASGYVTGYWGKWGYGGSKDQNNPVIVNIQTLPTSHGYKHVLAELHHIRAHTFFQPTLWRAPAAPGAPGGIELAPNSLAAYRNNPNYPNPPALQDHPEYPDTAYCDDTYAFAALDFVRTQGRNYNQTGQPFFGLLAVQIPHAPFGEITALPGWDRAYAGDPHFAGLSDQSRQWAAMVTRIDAHFGNILAALEDPDQDGDPSDSIAADTLVIFQSDNGGPGGKNNVELNANGGLRGTKGRIQEGGIRVPLVMRWPSRITANSVLVAGTTTDRIVDVTDLLPTFCDLAGAPTPLGIDGVSLAPTLLGQGHQRKREFLIHQANNGQSIIRGKHKLVRTSNRKGKKTTLELYDLEADHAEEHDLAAAHPELVSELEALLLGERVTEPKGFANTYHHWTGKDGAVTSSADNWSDYVYANAGITYLSHDGAPRLSWTARIGNNGATPSTVRADADLEVLGLEIRGGAGSASQTLSLDPGINLTGRNEIRLSSNAKLVVDGGTVSSLRWIELLPGALIEGGGTIDAIVHSAGRVAPSAHGGFEVKGDYHQTTGATLHAVLSTGQTAPLHIHGKATLAGSLRVKAGNGFTPDEGSPITIVAADRIEGRFSNPEDLVTAEDGTRFSIRYTDTTVTLAPAPQ